MVLLKCTNQSLYPHIPCEVCGNFGHSGNDYLETHEDALINNNRFRPWEVQGGISHTRHIRKEQLKSTGIQHRTIRLWASLGEDPHKVTCILHSHHFSLPCIKKEGNTKKERSLIHHSMFSLPLDDSCISFHASSLYTDMFWFRVLVLHLLN